MAVESNTDRDVFFDTDEFGDEFSYSGSLFNVIFNNDHVSDEEVSTDRAEAVCKTADVTSLSLAVGETITQTSSSIDYVIRDIHNDGTGISHLLLEEQ
jgi:hypothetical protein